jgi:uncharacterized protein (TIGR02271 family)
MLDREQVLDSRGSDLLAEDGSKLGTIVDIYVDRETDEPEWALVKMGLLGSKSNFVPLRDATMEGSDILVPYSKDHVQGAPTMDADGDLSQQDEAELYRYYGLDYSEQPSNSGLPEGDDSTTGTQRRDGEGRDASSPSTDDAMTRSEEELHVGKTEQEAGRARLKKYVVTEQVQQTVPVQREEVRIEREPVTEANIDQSTGGPDISESEHEVVLKEEKPVVEKQTVPKERVRLTKDTVTDEHEVSEEVRREQIEEEGEIRR